MPESGYQAWEPVSFAGARLDAHRHVCAFVQSRSEAYRMLDPFILEGIARGEKVSCIVDPAERVGWVSHYRQQGLQLPQLLESGQFELSTWSETHLQGGRFDPDAMLRLSAEQMERSPFQRIRMVSDMGWAVHYQGSRDLVAYEARANMLVAKHQHVVICVYDAAKFGGDVILNILRTHPLVLLGGILHANPYFVPPEQFLAELEGDVLEWHRA